MRQPAAWSATEFGMWAAEYGVHRLALQLRVRDEAIYQWLRGWTAPRPALAMRTVELSAGRLTIETIYRHAAAARAAHSAGPSGGLSG